MSFNLRAALNKAGVWGGGAPPVTALDFLAGLPSGFTLTRGGDDRLARDTNGLWQRYAGNTPRIHCDELGTPLGMVVERSILDRGRLGFNYASAPVSAGGAGFAFSALSANAPLSMTPDPATLSELGWQSILTSALRSSAVASGLDGTNTPNATVGTVDPVSYQWLVRDIAVSNGSNFNQVSLSGTATSNSVAFDEWIFASTENRIPTTTTKSIGFLTRAGHHFDIAGFWFARDKYNPLPYWRGDGVVHASANEWMSAVLTTLPGYSGSGFTLLYEWHQYRPFTADGEPIITLLDSGASGDYVRVTGRADLTMRVEVFIGGANILTSDFAQPGRNLNHSLAVRCVSGSWVAAVDGVLGTPVATAATIANLNTLHIGRDGANYGCHMARSLALTGNLTDFQVAAASTSVGGYI